MGIKVFVDFEFSSAILRLKPTENSTEIIIEINNSLPVEWHDIPLSKVVAGICCSQ